MIKYSVSYKIFSACSLLLSSTSILCGAQKLGKIKGDDIYVGYEECFSGKRLKNPHTLYEDIRTYINNFKYTDEEIVRILTDCLGDRTLGSIQTKYHKTLLHCAAQTGSTKILKIIFSIVKKNKWSLLKMSETHHYYTALHIATINRDEKFVKKLLDLAGENAWDYVRMHAVRDLHVDDTRMLAARVQDKKIFEMLCSYAPSKKEKHELSYEAAQQIIQLQRQREEARQRNIERGLARL